MKLRIIYFVIAIVFLAVFGSCADSMVDPETARVRADEVNEAPVAVNDSVVAVHSRPALVNVLENDYDRNGPLAVSSLEFEQPGFGVVVRAGDSLLSYSTAGNYLGPDSFTYTVEDDFGIRSSPATVVISVEVGPPEPPSLFRPKDQARDLPASVTLVWDSTRHTSTYEVQVATEERFIAPVFRETTEALQIQVGPLDRAIRFFWRVRGLNAAGKGDWSDTRSFFTMPFAPDAPLLVAPVNNATGVSIDVRLEWMGSGTANRYQVQVAENRALAEAIVNDETTETAYVVDADLLELGKRYYWRVRGSNAGGTGPWSATWVFQTKIPPPEAPELLSPADESVVSTLRPALRWYSSATPNVTYEVVLATDADFSSVVAATATAATAVRVSSGLLKPSAQYYWRVRSVSASGPGAWTDSRWFITPARNDSMYDRR